MIKTVQRGTVKLTLRDTNQVAAFLNNGWKECLEEENTTEEVATEEAPTTVAYTKTEINRMNKETLVAVATTAGIENSSEKSGTVLKNLLIKKFNL